MTALTEDIDRSDLTSPRTKFFPARANVVFKKGSIVCKRKDSEFAEIPDSSNPRTDLIPLGVAICALDMTGLSNGDYTIAVDPGLKADFDTGAGGDEITISHIGQTWYMYDDNTAYLTDDGGTLSPGGTIALFYTPEGASAAKPALHFECEQPQVLLAIAEANAAVGALTAADIPIDDAGGYTAETDVEGALQEIYPLVLAGMTASKKTLTADHTTITAAAATETVNIGTALPANSRIVGVDMHTLTPFSGGTVADFTVDVGMAGDVDALIDGADLFAAAVDGGPATMPQGVRPNKFYAAGGQLIATFRCASDDVGDATAGAVTIDVIYVVLA